MSRQKLPTICDVRLQSKRNLRSQSHPGTEASFFSHYQTAKYTGILRQPPPFAVRLVTSKVTKILKGTSLKDKVCLQNSEGTWQSQVTLDQLNSIIPKENITIALE